MSHHDPDFVLFVADRINSLDVHPDSVYWATDYAELRYTDGDDE